jgi:hypothetical protein
LGIGCSVFSFGDGRALSDNVKSNGWTEREGTKRGRQKVEPGNMMLGLDKPMS